MMHGPAQSCFKCSGRGWCHDSSMTHDKPWNERCFFCVNCSACGGYGRMQQPPVNFAGPSAPYAARGSRGPMQRCFKCSGNGWSHQSSMTHDKDPGERCFFCKDCDACSGTGAIPGGGGGFAGAYGGGGGGGGMQRCFKCDGNGFCHNSSMSHDKDPGERCFFCKDCDGCGGSGAISGGGGSGGAWGYNRGPQRCFKCDGNGFCHVGSISHDKGPGERCFFCKDCDSCGGSGALR